jgi:energy-coupling factor transporter ATP-binding protein EcfA2
VLHPNVLVLDEPTNHLDLEAIDALVDVLKAYDGTTIFVAHDRAFVSALATRILEVTKDGFRDFPGTYDEYLARCGDDHLDADTVVLRAKKERGDKGSSESGKSVPPKGDAAGASGLSYEEEKRRKNRLKTLPKKRDELVAAIDAAEARKAAVQAGWCEAGFYEKTAKDVIAALEAEEKSLGPKIEALIAEWEAIEAELEAAASS